LCSTRSSIRKETTVLSACIQSLANPTLPEKVSLDFSAKLCSVLSRRRAAPKIRGKAPKIATIARFPPVTSDRITVLRRDTMKMTMAPRLALARDFAASGSIARRETRIPGAFAHLTEKAMGCYSVMLVIYAKR
jgi:hypothetical protein